MLYKCAGANDDEVTPVPIPNTEVKLISAHNTWTAGSREDRSTPAYTFKKKRNALIAQLALRVSAAGGRRSELEKVQRKGAMERKLQRDYFSNRKSMR